MWPEIEPILLEENYLVRSKIAGKLLIRIKAPLCLLQPSEGNHEVLKIRSRIHERAKELDRNYTLHG